MVPSRPLRPFLQPEAGDGVPPQVSCPVFGSIMPRVPGGRQTMQMTPRIQPMRPVAESGFISPARPRPPAPGGEGTVPGQFLSPRSAVAGGQSDRRSPPTGSQTSVPLQASPVTLLPLSASVRPQATHARPAATFITAPPHGSSAQQTFRSAIVAASESPPQVRLTSAIQMGQRTPAQMRPVGAPPLLTRCAATSPPLTVGSSTPYLPPRLAGVSIPPAARGSLSATTPKPSSIAGIPPLPVRGIVTPPSQAVRGVVVVSPTQVVRGAAVNPASQAVRGTAVASPSVRTVVAAPVPQAVRGVVAAPGPQAVRGVVAAPVPQAVRGVVAAPVPQAVRGVVAAPVPQVVRGVVAAPVPQAVRGVVAASVPQAVRGVVAASVPQAVRGVVAAPVPQAVRGAVVTPASHAAGGAVVTPASQAARGVIAAPVPQAVRGAVVTTPPQAVRGSVVTPPSQPVRGSAVSPPSQVVRGAVAIPPSPSVTAKVPPQAAIRVGNATAPQQIRPTVASIQPVLTGAVQEIQPVRAPSVRPGVLACAGVTAPQVTREAGIASQVVTASVGHPPTIRCAVSASQVVRVPMSVQSMRPVALSQAVRAALHAPQLIRGTAAGPRVPLARPALSAPPAMRGAPPITALRIPLPVASTADSTDHSPTVVRSATPSPPLLKSTAPSGGSTPFAPAHAERGIPSMISTDDMAETIHQAFGDTPPAALERACPGTLGKKIDLVSNLFGVQLPRGNVFHYDVEVRAEGATGEEPVPSTTKARSASTIINRRVIEALSRAFPEEMDNCLPAFDGRKNLYTRRRLPNTELVLCTEIDDNGIKRNFQARLRYAATVSLDNIYGMYEGKMKPELFQEAIQAADVILRTGPTLRFVPVGRSFFTAPKKEDGDCKLGGGRELWFGFYTSIRLGVWQPLVNVDMSATAFYCAGPLLNLIQETLDPGPNHRFPNLLNAGLNEKQRVAVLREIRTLKVRVTHLDNRRQHRIENVTRKSANEESFEWDGRLVTVAKYFAEKYQYNLKYPALPCVQVGKKGTMLPIECCELMPGQHCRRKLSDLQTKKMIKRTAVIPEKRFRRLQSATSTLAQSASNHCSEFGMKLDANPVTVEGRVLDGPVIKYRNRTVKAVHGVWKLESQFFKAASLSSWAIAVLGDVKPKRVEFVIQQFQQEGGKLGMQIAEPALVMNYGHRVKPQKVLEDVKNRVPHVDITLILLSQHSDYGLIKATAETSDLCMRTQCVKSSNINDDGKFNGAFTQNLLQKINTKLGGINNGVVTPRPSAFTKPFMVVGIDVNHSGPGDTGTPSVASVVASMDATPAQYYAITQVQVSKGGNRIECVVGLKEMFLECLHKFHEKNKVVPERIFIYRDGVSEAQFDAVRAYELAAMRAACSTFKDDFTPSMVLIVLQKRHHVRFMPVNAREGFGRSGNIPPGTVVDTKIVHPGMFDFYICSHQGAQGTSRPTHYHVVHDDAGHSPDEIYQISYALCHMYARCTRAVSLPAPAYYAHLVAFRAKEHIKGVIYGGLSSSAGSDHGDSSSSSSDDIDLEKFTGAVKVNEKMRGMMYFV